MTATMCFEASRPAFFSASFTKASLVRVSRVVPDLDTSTNREWATSILLSTLAASSGSTLLMKRASSFRVLFCLAHCSRARYMARGPRSLPPMPICTTVVNFSPAALAISPLCTFLANSAAFCCWDT